jgi:hypothetical protein
MKNATAAVLASMLAACSAEKQYTPTSTKTAAARPENCEFDILTLKPARAIEELGIIDFQGGHIDREGRRTGVPSSAAELREKIGPEVCRAGGEAVFTEVNGLGQYVRATVVRYSPLAEATKAQ